MSAPMCLVAGCERLRVDRGLCATHLRDAHRDDARQEREDAMAKTTAMATCPDCGKEVKAVGLGIHRARAHGTPGSTPRAQKKASTNGAVAMVHGATPVSVALDALRTERERIDQAITALEALT